MLRLIKKHYLFLVISAFLLYAALAIFRSSFVVHNVRYFTLSDDLMIQMKYGYNLIHGHGLVWNAGGERVEGFTDPLWIIYLGLLQFAPLPLSKISILVQISGVIFMAGSLYFVKKIAAIVSGSSFLVVFLSLIFTAFYFPLINWSIILGTETSILTLFLTGSIYLTLKAVTHRKFSFFLCFFLGAGTLIRMDFVIPTAIMTSYLIIFDKKNRRKYLILGVPIVLSFIAVQELLRLWYYHEPLPNTYYFRMTGYPILMRMTRGLFVSIKAFMPNLISLNWLLILTPLIYAYLTKNRKILLLLAVFTGQIFYNIYVGGDSWEHYGGANHFFAFAMPLFFISLIMTLDSVRKLINHHSVRIQKQYKVIEIITICLFFLVLNRGANNTWSLSELFLIGKNITTLEKQIRVNEAYRINSITKPNAKISVSAAGIIPYFTHRFYVDALGKNDKVIAREAAHFSRKYDSLQQKYTSFYPGHMKWDYPYIIKKYKPDIFVEFYQNYGEHNEKYLERDYVKMLSPDGFAFFVLKGSPNVIIHDLKPE